MSAKWHYVGFKDGAWYRGCYGSDHPGYDVIAEADDGSNEPYEQAATAAILKTPEGYWGAEDGGGCSCWSGPSVESICGPYETIREALASISEALRERFDPITEIL